MQIFNKAELQECLYFLFILKKQEAWAHQTTISGVMQQSTNRGPQ